MGFSRDILLPTLLSVLSWDPVPETPTVALDEECIIAPPHPKDWLTPMCGQFLSLPSSKSLLIWVVPSDRTCPHTGIPGVRESRDLDLQGEKPSKYIENIQSHSFNNWQPQMTKVQYESQSTFFIHICSPQTPHSGQLISLLFPIHPTSQFCNMRLI